jgi:hypothetical protein
MQKPEIVRYNIRIAEEIKNFTGIAAAEILQKVYNHNGNKDSAYQYALMQIAIKILRVIKSV